MIWIVLSLIGIIFEGMAIGCLVLKTWVFHGIFAFLILHLLAAIIVAFAISRFLRKNYPISSPAFIILLAWLNFFVLGLGVIITTFVGILLYYLGKRALPPIVEQIDPDINLDQIKPLLLNYGAGGARISLLSPTVSVKNRTEALIAISSRVSPLTNILMKELLPDEQDEIRLLAFSLLAEQENHLGEEISSSLKLLKTISNKTMRARLQKNIALLYWEIIYRQLLPHDLQSFILQQSLQYTQQALQVLSQDAALQTLLGKIYYRLGDVKASKVAFNHALELAASPAHVIPYLTEIDYGKGDFVELKKIFQATPSLTELPIIGRVAQFWMHT